MYVVVVLADALIWRTDGITSTERVTEAAGTVKKCPGTIGPV